MKAVIRVITVGFVMALMSCTDDGCWDCYNESRNGVITEVCIQVDCSDLLN